MNSENTLAYQNIFWWNNKINLIDFEKTASSLKLARKNEGALLEVKKLVKV